MKILLVIDNLKMGGIASSFYNLLEYLSTVDIETNILVFDLNTINLDKVPKNVKILHGNDDLMLLGISQKELLEVSLLKYLKRLFYVFISRLVSGKIARSLLFRGMDLEGEFDFSIAYCHDLGWNAFTPGCGQFVQRIVKSKEKAIYIHCDYENYGGFDKRQLIEYEQFSKILCVSKGCEGSFLKCFPKLKNRTEILENFINDVDIKELSKNSLIYDKDLVTFVSVSRLSVEKGIVRTIKILKRIVEYGCKNFQWIIVGDGPDRNSIENYIESNDMGEFITLVGEKSNPYIYIKNADAFLLLSYHEAAPMVFGECRVLGVPVITTNTISVKELVEDRKAGIVCNNDEDSIFDTINMVLSDPGLLEKYRVHDPDVNKTAIQQLRRLLQ